MSTPIRVLIVEDNPDDAELMALELSRGGLAPDGRRVEPADEMRAALHREPWGVALGSGRAARRERGCPLV